MQRSGSSGGHQRQYSNSDNFIDTNFNNKWLQSAGLHHLYSSNPNLPPLQDFGFYGNNDVEGSRLNRNSQRITNAGGNADSLNPSACSRSSSFTKYGSGEEVSLNEFSPGLLDLHAIDTELLTEVESENNLNLLNQPLYGEGFDDLNAYALTSKFANISCGPTENNILKSSLADKEKASNVAKIKVVVRKRPLNKKEIAKREEDIISINPNTSSLTVHESKVKVDLTEYVEKHGFVFDAVMNEDVTNDEVGSGKTYTMQPLPLKASQDIFRLMHHSYRNQGFQLFVSFFEIYGGKVFDLLNDRNKLCMREDGKQQVCIVGLQEYKVSNVETVKELIERGNATRSTGTTGANEESSRSHAILQLAVKRLIDGNESKPPRLVGKLSFIDLAGSERGADTTDNDKQTRVKSLSKGNNSRKDLSSSTSNLRNSVALPLSSVPSTMTRSEDVKLDRLPYETNRFGWTKQTDREFSPSLNMEPVGRSTTHLPSTVSPENYKSDYGGTDEEVMEDDFDNSMETHEPKNMPWMSGNKKAAGIQKLQTRLRNFQKRLEEYNVLSSASGGN
ncbi:Kinesin, motor domain-containing protein [Cynara cardunculus var. scolymus]|uniref:Kinesin-like protein n=1 Tax=Cynara cardunculus var. scolymus TaxID=59895 RepID=A0A103XN62_CYNCS|nr:Kinesin, motor domain-containing protein [Cynara cardunculus var. scolymus]